MIRVLYICNEDRRLGGASLSLMDMLESLSGAVRPLILLREDGLVAEAFRARGYACMVVPFFRGTFQAKGLVRMLRFLPHALHRAWVQARCVRRVKRELAGQIDLVHSNSGTVDIGLRIAKALGVRHIWHIREYLDLGLGMRPFPSMAAWKRKLQKSDAVIAITPGLAAHLGLDQARCIPDAVCPDSAPDIVPVKDPYLLFVAGSMSAAKRPQEAVDLFRAAALSEQYKLRMVGEGAAAFAAPDIEALPFTDALPELYRHASAVLICSPYEGMGRVCVEAMFYGCPVVARGSGGSADVLQGGRLGALYSSVQEGADALVRVVQDPPLAQLQAAAEEAVRQYSRGQYGERILALYHEFCHA